MYKRWIVMAMAGMLLATIFACATPAGRSAGQVLDDSTITTKVKTLILEDSFMKGLAISVTTFNGKVTLTGGVNTAEQKKKAEDLARSVSGVTGVNNNLEIKK